MPGEFTYQPPEPTLEPVPQAPPEMAPEQPVAPVESAPPPVETPPSAPDETAPPVEALVEGSDADAVAKGMTDTGTLSKEAVSEAVSDKLDGEIQQALSDKGIAPTEAPFKAGDLGSTPSEMSSAIAATRERAETVIGDAVRQQEQDRAAEARDVPTPQDNDSAAETKRLLDGAAADEAARQDRIEQELENDDAMREEAAADEARRASDAVAQTDPEGQHRTEERLKHEEAEEAEKRAAEAREMLENIEEVDEHNAEMSDFMAENALHQTIGHEQPMNELPDHHLKPAGHDEPLTALLTGMLLAGWGRNKSR